MASSATPAMARPATVTSSVYRMLKRNGIGPLPKKASRRTLHTRRYAKQVPGHHIQVERSHRTDQEEFYQLLTYTDDVDLNQKLAAWESFHNLNRPHGAHGGKTPYEALRCLSG